jgi:hypothetical protein
MSVRILGSGGEQDMSTHCDEDLMSCGESKSQVIIQQKLFHNIGDNCTVEPKTGFKNRKINKYIDFETELLEQGATPLQHCGR